MCKDHSHMERSSIASPTKGNGSACRHHQACTLVLRLLEAQTPHEPSSQEKREATLGKIPRPRMQASLRPTSRHKACGPRALSRQAWPWGRQAHLCYLHNSLGAPGSLFWLLLDQHKHAGLRGPRGSRWQSRGHSQVHPSTMLSAAPQPTLRLWEPPQSSLVLTSLIWKMRSFQKPYLALIFNDFSFT